MVTAKQTCGQDLKHKVEALSQDNIQLREQITEMQMNIEQIEAVIERFKQLELKFSRLQRYIG
jgi:predicted nuclease with TOPRIM domain